MNDDKRLKEIEARVKQGGKCLSYHTDLEALKYLLSRVRAAEKRAEAAEEDLDWAGKDTRNENMCFACKHYMQSDEGYECVKEVCCEFEWRGGGE